MSAPRVDAAASIQRRMVSAFQASGRAIASAALGVVTILGLAGAVLGGLFMENRRRATSARRPRGGR